MTATVDPRALDFTTLAYLSGLSLQEAVLAQLASKHPHLRFAHGYLFQHLIGGAKDVGALAALLGVTSQAASKSVRELERLDYVEVVAQPDDARRSVVQLTKRAWASIEETRALRAAQEQALVDAVGARDVEAAKRALVRALELAGGVEAVRARRVRAPR